MQMRTGATKILLRFCLKADCDVKAVNLIVLNGVPVKSCCKMKEVSAESTLGFVSLLNSDDLVQ